jgi:cytidylate kinase
MIGSIDQFVNQQILRWQEQRRIADRKGLEGKHAQQPTICISREYGARGAAMGRMVAQELGLRFYSQELIHDIAEQAQVVQQVVELLDERVQDGIAQWVSSMIKSGAFAPSDYVRNLSKVVLTLSRQSRAVIIGRGANFILERAKTLRVRVVSPLDTRTARIARRDNLGEEQAREKVLRIDAEREAFNRQHYNADIRDPLHYDLVLNSGTMGLEECAALTVHAFRLRFRDG